MKPLILFIALGHALSAQSADEIIRHHIDADKINRTRAAQYTYVEEDTHFEYDKSGVAKQTSTETYDIVFVEGEEYKKLVTRNGQPLSVKDQAKEEKKLQDAAKERRKQRRNGLFHREFHIGTADNEMLMTHFENRVTGAEEINGRKVWVVESVPRPDKKPANDHERDVLSVRWTQWIDQADGMAAKWQMIVVGDKVLLKPGSAFRCDLTKLNEEAWVATFCNFEFRMKERTRMEAKLSNYRKFDVQSTITIDPAP